MPNSLRSTMALTPPAPGPVISPVSPVQQTAPTSHTAQQASHPPGARARTQRTHHTPPRRSRVGGPSESASKTDTAHQCTCEWLVWASLRLTGDLRSRAAERSGVGRAKIRRSGPRQYLPARPPESRGPGPDSAEDHEALHAHSLPGIVMCARNALLSVRRGSSRGADPGRKPLMPKVTCRRQVPRAYALARPAIRPTETRPGRGDHHLAGARDRG
jgi:hypothetical protein